MVQRTLINGTGYTIIGGRTLIDGTGYAIKKGRTLIGGTGYDIKLNKYRLDSWIGGDGDEYITELSRSWSAIRKGQDVSHSMTTKVSASTNGKAYSGFLLTGLEVGDKVEIAYSFETTAGNGFYIDCIMTRLPVSALIHRIHIAERSPAQRRVQGALSILQSVVTTITHTPQPLPFTR